MMSIRGSGESSGNLRVEDFIVADSVTRRLCDRSSEQNPKQGSVLEVGVFSFKRWRCIFQLKKPL